MKKRKKIKKLFNEFKNFAFKEAALGAAIGIMLGAAFRDVVNSLVNDILTPPVGYLTSGIDFTSLYFVLGENNFDSLSAAKEAGAVVIHYGNFINEFITFLITAFILFLITYQAAKLVNNTESKKKKKRVCPYCKTEVHLEATKCPACASPLKKE